MNLTRRLPGWLAALAAVAGLALLYRGPLRTGFLNDDYLFLEQARTRPLLDSLAGLGALGNYYRPLARQIYFEVLTPLSGGHPLVFHLVGFALFLAALALVLDLLRVLVPAGAAIAGALFMALLPFQRVMLTWVSCSQDLLALLGVLGAFALWRRGRTGGALAAYLGALASKETALALPVALLAWGLWIERRPARDAIRRALPLAALAGLWGVVVLVMRARHPAAAADLHPTASYFAAGLVHGVQSLLGLDDPPGFLDGLGARLPDPAALVPLAALALAIGGGRPPAAGEHPSPRASVKFALAWIAAFALVAGPVAHTWSAYYYSLAAVGAALLVALACRRMTRVGALALVVGLLWWNAAGSSVRAFAVRSDPWQWTSHLTAFYFERAALLTADLSRDLRAAEPDPPRDTRFFFGVLPSWAGFQMGNGALVRALYRDPSLESHFYSQFSDSLVGGRPCRFLYWNGDSLIPLYRHARDPWFQIGCDLLMLDRPEGAADAFRRGLAAGGDPHDHLYWLGWAWLWAGRRDPAEAAWLRMGARDDTLRWRLALREARTALVDQRDSLRARRFLVEAIRHGIGRPEAHAVLGPLLMGEQPKYGLLELKVARFLKPDDWMTCRDLALGLMAVGYTDAARREVAAYQALRPGWRLDGEIAHADSVLRLADEAGRDVARFR